MTEKNNTAYSTDHGRQIIECMVDIANTFATSIAESAERPKSCPDYTDTERMLHRMLTESTGANILDSGGAYGRHWENARRIADFRDLSESVIDRRMGTTRHVFEIVRNIASYDKEMDKEFFKFANSPENTDEAWPTIMEKFSSMYGEESDDFTGGGNTYNDEFYVGNQGIQYEFFNTEDASFVLLQLHNGCDIRGGYTAPHAFQCRLEDFVMACNEMTISCGCTVVYLLNGMWEDGEGCDAPESWEDGLFKHWNWKTDRIIHCSKCNEKVS